MMMTTLMTMTLTTMLTMTFNKDDADCNDTVNDADDNSNADNDNANGNDADDDANNDNADNRNADQVASFTYWDCFEIKSADADYTMRLASFLRRYAGRTYGWTDKPFYRNARKHLKTGHGRMDGRKNGVY